MGVGDLHIISEDIIKADLQGSDARCLHLTPLDIHQILLPGARQVPELVKFSIDIIGNKVTFRHQDGSISLYHLFDTLADRITLGHLLTDGDNRSEAALKAKFFYHLNLFQGARHLKHLPWVHPSERHLRHETLKVTNLTDSILKL